MVLQNNDINLNNVCVSGIRSVALFDVQYTTLDDDIGCSGHQILIESGISKRMIARSIFWHSKVKVQVRLWYC